MEIDFTEEIDKFKILKIQPLRFSPFSQSRTRFLIVLVLSLATGPVLCSLTLLLVCNSTSLLLILTDTTK